MPSRFSGPGYDFTLDIPEGWRLITVQEHNRYTLATTLLSDLDRCEHGRHAGDICGSPQPNGCNGPSRGNPFLQPGQRIGTTLHAGHHIRVPAFGPHIRTDLGDPTIWIPSL